ncbi:MAG: DUF445 family protein [Bacteroidota bacterium]
MPDSASSDTANDEPRGRRDVVPVPGVIDLDAVDADARQALWGSADGEPDAEDEALPPAEDVPASPPPAVPTGSPPQPPVPPDSTKVEQKAPGLTAPEPPLQGLEPSQSASSSPQPETLPAVPAPPPPPPPATRWDADTAYRTKRSPQSTPPDPTSPPPETGDAPGNDGDLDSPEAASTPPATDAEPTLRAPDAVVQTAKEATKDRGRELVALVTEYGKRHIPETPTREREPDTGPPRLVGRIGQLIPILRVIPWLLAAGFAFSFVWDFPEAAVSVFGRVIPLEGLLRILSISGMIGFLTNWLAITMLFQPREKRAIIPQGLIPAQRERVIYRLSDAISRELINADIIKQKIQESGVIGRYRDLGLSVVRGVVEDPGFRADLKTLAQRYAQETLGSESLRRELAKVAVDKVEEQAGQGLGGVALKLYRTFAEDDFQRRVDNALSELPQAVTPLLNRIDEALDAVPAKVEARGDEIEEAATKAVLSFVEGFDIQAMIQEKARGFDEAQLENLLKSTSNEQLNYIKYLGGILGVFGGLVIWRAEMLIVFVAIGLVLWALDEVLVRARRRSENSGF